MGKKIWRLGTRGSQLATAQSGLVAQSIRDLTGDEVELVIITTKGDQVVDRPLSKVGGKGLFTKELEDALLSGDVDLAVHSMKDMPTDNPPGLVIAGVPHREDPRDALVGSTLDALPEGAVVGTGSARRKMQLLAKRPDLDVRGIRGNVDTRIRKQREGQYDAIVLAVSGLKRLGLEGVIDEHLDPSWMIPAAGQGALAIQTREDHTEMLEILTRLSHTPTVNAVEIERAFLAELEGGCSVPAAVHAVVGEEEVGLSGFFGREDGVWYAESGTTTPQDAKEAAIEMAARLKKTVTHQREKVAEPEG